MRYVTLQSRLAQVVVSPWYSDTSLGVGSNGRQPDMVESGKSGSVDVLLVSLPSTRQVLRKPIDKYSGTG